MKELMQLVLDQAMAVAVLSPLHWYVVEVVDDDKVIRQPPTSAMHRLRAAFEAKAVDWFLV